jgi:hypothetical protein
VSDDGGDSRLENEESCGGDGSKGSRSVTSGARSTRRRALFTAFSRAVGASLPFHDDDMLVFSRTANARKSRDAFALVTPNEASLRTSEDPRRRSPERSGATAVARDIERLSQTRAHG